MKLILNAFLFSLLLGSCFEILASEKEDLSILVKLSNFCDVKIFNERTENQFLKVLSRNALNGQDLSACDLSEPSWKRITLAEKMGFKTRWLVDRVLMLDGPVRLKKVMSEDDMLGRALLGYAKIKGRKMSKEATLGFSLVSEACESGEIFGCLTKTFSIYLGEGIKADRTTGKILFKDLCEKGLGNACDAVGNLHVFGEANAEKNADIFNDYFTKACTANTGRGCRRLADSYKQGRGVEVDLSTALDLYIKACNLNDDVGCVNAWDTILDTSDSDNPDMTTFVTLLESACTVGNGAGCFKLGDAYNKGRYRIPQDATAAYQGMEMACQRGQSNGCYNQGSWLIQGKGVSANSREAIKVLQPLCDREKPDYQACNNAGAAAFRGIGMRAPAYAEAGDFYRKACYFGGMKTACESIIDMIEDGQIEPVQGNELSVLRERVKQ